MCVFESVSVSVREYLCVCLFLQAIQQAFSGGVRKSFFINVYFFQTLSDGVDNTALNQIIIKCCKI